MDFAFTEEQEILRRTVREWAMKNLTLEKVREMDTKQEIPREILKGIADLGLIGMTIPEDHGGAGADWVSICLAAEELAHADISMASVVFTMVLSGWAFAVDRHCTEQVREVVRKAIKGESFVGIATTEPGGGSDLTGFKSTAKKQGKQWVLNGEKTYISGTEELKKYGGGYYVLTYTAPELSHRGMTAFYLPIKTPGVEVAKRFDDMGRMALSTGGFTMKDVKLPEYYLIGEENKGFYYTMEGFNLARLILSATCIGAAQRALEIGMDYIKERKAFGSPIGKFEGIQFELADHYAELEATRGLIYKAAWMVDEMYKNKRFTSFEVGKWISLCKLKAPALAFDIFKDTMVWCGAWGYTKECPLEMGLRATMSYCVGAEGAKNIQRIIIGRELLGKEFIPYR